MESRAKRAEHFWQGGTKVLIWMGGRGLDGGTTPYWAALGGHPETDQKNYLDAPLIGQLGST